MQVMSRGAGLAAAPALMLAVALPASAQQQRAIDQLIQSSGLQVAGRAAMELSVPARKRYAIVIGNGNYDSVADLDNSVADAELVAGFLEAQGYTTHLYRDVRKSDFEGIFRKMLMEVDNDTEVVFYYAGHGIQIGDKNYIAPVEATLSSGYDVPFEAVSLQSIVSIIGSRARAQMVILDSCRDNPFGQLEYYADLNNISKESQSGFVVQSAPVNALLAYSTSPGELAYDGAGPNSPYTTALIEAASEMPGTSMSALMEEVRRRVYQRTGGRQVSWESSTLVTPLNFASRGDGKIRSLVPVSAVAAEPGETRGVVQNVTISLPFGSEVAIGPALQSRLGAVAVGDTEVTTPPESGTIFADGTATGLVYSPDSSVIPAAQRSRRAFNDVFTLRAGEAVVQVDLTLEPNQCDWQAGDYLDPEGSGIARFPNEIDPAAAIAACTEAVLEEPESGRFHYQLGRSYVSAGDLDAARRSFERARDLGHTRAWYALGLLEVQKRRATGGVAREETPEEALAYYAVAAQQGDPYAFHTLGRHLMLDGDTLSERQEGFELLSRAVEVGHTFAMNELGFYFLDEENPYYDPERGMRYLLESAARGDIYGYANLGSIYYRGGPDVQQDLVKAYEYFRRAAEGGHPSAPTDLGEMFLRGEVDGTPDTLTAMRWYDTGLERGDAWGGVGGAWIVANRDPEGYGPADAAERAAKAAVLNSRSATDAAMDILERLPVRAVDQASQKFMAEFGQDITVDGAFGPQSLSAFEAVAADAPFQPQGSSAIDRLLFLARLHWTRSAIRVDVY